MFKLRIDNLQIKIKSYFLFILIGLSFPLLSQENQKEVKTYNLEVGFLQGIIIRTELFPDSKIKHPIGGDIIYWKDIPNHEKSQLDTFDIHKVRNKTNILYNYPLVGPFASFLTNFDEKIGTAFSLGAAADIGLLQKGSSYLSFRPRLGAAYFTNSHDLVTNPDNVFIGSRINFHIQGDLYYTFQEPVNTFKIGIGVTHYSNGTTNLPNFGLNIFNIHAAYQFGPKLFPWDNAHKQELKEAFLLEPKTPSFFVQGGGFSKQFQGDFSTRFYGFKLAAGAVQKLNPYLDINAQALYFYDPSINRELEFWGFETVNNNRVGLSLGFGIEFHRFRFNSNAGIYVFKPEDELDQSWFQQYQISYTISPQFYVFGELFSHLADGDFTNFGIGYKL